MKGYHPLVVSVLLFSSQVVFGGETICSDPDTVILTDRGLVTDTACVVPKNRVLVEGGYQYQNQVDNFGTFSTYPLTQITLGLPNNMEIYSNLPSYNDLHKMHIVGAGATEVGLRAEVYSTRSLALSGEAIVLPPGGSRYFGSNRIGAAVNALSLYRVNSRTLFASMIGGASKTMPFVVGGDRYNSFNYATAILYKPIDRINLFAEIFGETKTSSITGSGLDWNLGMFFELNENIVADIEYVSRFNGVIDGFKNYVGAGLTIYFA